MRRQRHVRPIAGGCDRIAHAVDRSLPTERAELLQKPRRPVGLLKRRRRHAAQFQVLFADPLLLAREPLQALLHPAMIRQLVEVHPVRRADSHLFECSSREAGTVLALRRRAIINRRLS